MLTFVVMPCLNEAELVEGSAASLGFRDSGPVPGDTHLIVVDNGSTDRTMHILKDIQRRSVAPVHILTEPTRGFVPPRRRGVAEAEDRAAQLGADLDRVLILQADADTSYREGYAANMQRAANKGRGVVLEGSTKPPDVFATGHPAYLAAQRMVDSETDPLAVEDEVDVVLDDKICGYHLADYLEWGGLFEESCPDGDAIHAETTRMFIRARLRHGARKVRVNLAGAMPSRRKVIEDPWLQFATVGFPREASWIARQRLNSPRFASVDAFAQSVLSGEQPEAVYLRRAHQLALFRYLPWLVLRAAGDWEGLDPPTDVTAVLLHLGDPSIDDLSARPGHALMEILALVDQRPELFEVSRSAA